MMMIGWRMQRMLFLYPNNNMPKLPPKYKWSLHS